MKRRDEMIVGSTILIGMAVVVAGALWMSEAQLGALGTPYAARFRTVGGLGVGNPVVLRGVRVGRVEQIRLAEGDWVEAVLQIHPDVVLPSNPAIIAASASLFGEWQAEIIGFDDEIDDPTVRRALNEAAAAGRETWPGATLPDIGQLTAQAGRIASDIASFSNRVETAFDEEVVRNLQQSIRSFTRTADEINQFAETQTSVLGGVAEEFRTTSTAISQTAVALERTMARVDSSTSDGRLDTLMQDIGAIAEEFRVAVQDFQGIIGAVAARQGSIDRIMIGTDSLMTRISDGAGTVGRLVGDSTLYIEATLAVAELRALIADIKDNPRKYFKFSVF